MGTKRSCRGKIKACQIHDILHDFCKERAKEKNLLLVINRYRRSARRTSRSRSQRTGSTPTRRKGTAGTERHRLRRDQNSSHSPLVYCHKQHRISIYGDRDPIGEWSSFESHVVSIILHESRLPKDIVTHIFRSFRFIKVLDLGDTYIHSFPADLIYLRFFAGNTENMSTLSNITNCWNLETLLLKYYSSSRFKIQDSLLEMGKLRHLHISNFRFKIENAEGILENSKKLNNLRTLSDPYFSCIRDAELLLSRTPYLHELRCKVDSINNFRDYVLKFPIRLETLKIKAYVEIFGILPFCIFGILPFCISAPNLKQLTLVNFSLHPQHLSEIGLLQNLQVLKLHHFRNKGWIVRKDEFPQLKFLKLHGVYLEKWTVEDEAFPNLERLVLRTCYYLMEIPSSFRDISSLKSIEVEDCYKCVGKSARDIGETQVDDYQNVDFEVIISKERK